MLDLGATWAGESPDKRDIIIPATIMQRMMKLFHYGFALFFILQAGGVSLQPCPHCLGVRETAVETVTAQYKMRPSGETVLKTIKIASVVMVRQHHSGYPMVSEIVYACYRVVGKDRTDGAGITQDSVLAAITAAQSVSVEVFGNQ